jgi:hypothetical protein
MKKSGSANTPSLFIRRLLTERYGSFYSLGHTLEKLFLAQNF